MKKSVFNKVSIAADHAGFEMKEKIAHFLLSNKALLGIESFFDYGVFCEDSVDYPHYANIVAQSIQNHEKACGILICGSGIGMNIAANRFSHIRSAQCYNAAEIQLARQHNNVNILTISANHLKNFEKMEIMLQEFLTTEFSNEERHVRRNEML